MIRLEEKLIIIDKMFRTLPEVNHFIPTNQEIFYIVGFLSQIFSKSYGAKRC